MFEAVESPCLVPFDGSFELASATSSPPEDRPPKKAAKKKLEKLVDELSDLQKILYAHDSHAILLIFQAMDAAGKDGTIRAVLSGVNPVGCQVFSFKAPSHEELEHDFLWRTSRNLPERGRIGVFNRSYYEEVLVVRVHPEYLDAQRIPPDCFDPDTIWSQRLESIRDHEKHLARNGVVILKFWLNVSREEQRERFLARLDEPEKNWKFSAADVAEAERWDDYMKAYEEAVRETSRPWAPWYAIPADSKPWMRLSVADIIVRSLQTLDLKYPKAGKAELARFEELRGRLEKKDSD